MHSERDPAALKSRPVHSRHHVMEARVGRTSMLAAVGGSGGGRNRALVQAYELLQRRIKQR